MKPNSSIKFIIALLASAYFLWCVFNPGDWHFIDNVNLVIHEGGHFIFMFFGQFLYVLGGSLTQVLIPLLFVVYFWQQGQSFSAALTLFWVGESVLNVAWYAADAVKMQLPLLFGDDSIHDWHWLLSTTGLLSHTDTVAFVFRLIGIIVIIVGMVWSLYALKEKEDIVFKDF